MSHGKNKKNISQIENKEYSNFVKFLIPRSHRIICAYGDALFSSFTNIRYTLELVSPALHGVKTSRDYFFETFFSWSWPAPYSVLKWSVREGK